MRVTSITLCAPDREKSCFACCPPIRPAGYDHADHKNIIRKILGENTARFDKAEKEIIRITGFSCWALGYLDREHKLVGCMLHPAQNEGVDLRYRVDYGNKCQRETCPEAKTFSILTDHEKKFWLHLAAGLDSFSYSSRKMNPLFNIMGWGDYLLRLISSVEAQSAPRRQSFSKTYPFFSTTVLPRANAYLINHLVSEERIHLLKSDLFRTAFEQFSHRVSARLIQELSDKTGGAYVHRLDLDRDFLDLLRLSARISKIDLRDALRLKESVDKQVQEFKDGLH